MIHLAIGLLAGPACLAVSCYHAKIREGLVLSCYKLSSALTFFIVIDSSSAATSVDLEFGLMESADLFSTPIG